MTSKDSIKETPDSKPAKAGEPPENKLALASIKDVEIEEEMKDSYLNYAMSVIVSRALPDVKDGLRLVHSRRTEQTPPVGLRLTRENS